MVNLKGLILANVLCMAISHNPCVYKWSYKSEPDTCTTAKDCQNPNAECTYSVFANQRICCSAKKDAVFPKCPNGRTAYSLGQFSKLTCNPQQEAENDPCPTGYECEKSVTDFTRYPDQPNYVCCKI